MTDRERWTVYPLLFLALGISLKDKLTETVNTKHLQCDTVVCKAIQVDDPKTMSRVSISGNAVQSKSMISRSLVIINDDNRQVAGLASNEHGGFVETLGTQTGVHSILGNFGQIAGLLFFDAQGVAHRGSIFASPVPVPRPQQTPAEPKPDEASQAEPTPAEDDGDNSKRDNSQTEQAEPEAPSETPDGSGASESAA